MSTATKARVDSAYQRLREHLAYLGLSTASEELAPALDRARELKLSTVEVLEDLLAKEADATRARRLHGRLRFAHYPLCGKPQPPAGGLQKRAGDVDLVDVDEAGRRALAEFFGTSAGLSAPAITRLTTSWSAEREAFMSRDLSEVDYVYCWVDGIHFTVRLEDATCVW